MNLNLKTAPTLQDKLSAANGRPSGFDYMRLVLASCIILFHTVVTSEGWSAQQSLLASSWRPFIAAMVPMFFAMSGFLVAGSLNRSKSLITFLGLRVLRIIPALAAVVFLCAFIVGPVFTNYSLRDYFGNAQLYTYMLNAIGFIHYDLPGLFSGNPNPNTVNGQLWTLPWELRSYIVCAALSFVGVFRHKHGLLATVLVLYTLHLAKLVYKMLVQTSSYEVGMVNGHTLIMIFLTGMLLYQKREFIPYSMPLFWAAILSSLCLLAIPPHGDGFVALPIAYATVYLGTHEFPRIKGLLSGDYSYGIFLYGYPIQQIVSSVPSLQHGYLNFLIAYPFALLCAVFSWWFIEKPSLTLRKYLTRFEEWYLAKRNALRKGLA